MNDRGVRPPRQSEESPKDRDMGRQNDYRQTEGSQGQPSRTKEFDNERYKTGTREEVKRREEYSRDQAQRTSG